MKQLLAITQREFCMQVRRPFLWIALVLVNLLAMVETFPNAGNFARLAYLDLCAYAAQRQFFVSIPVVGIVAAILIAGRVPMDRELGMDALLWTASHISPLTYSLGKWLGSFLALSLMPFSLAAAGLAVRAIFTPAACSPWMYAQALLVLGLVPLALITSSALLLGAGLGVRLASILLSIYVFWSQGFPSADHHGVTQVYRFLGNLTSLVFVPPTWPYQEVVIAGGWQTLGFQLGMALAFLALLVVGAVIFRKGGAYEPGI